MSWLAAMVGHARARAAVLALRLPKRSGLTVIRPAATHSHLVPGATDPFLSRLATIQINGDARNTSARVEPAPPAVSDPRWRCVLAATSGEGQQRVKSCRPPTFRNS